MLSMKFENLWVSATECRALMGSVRAIEQGLLELKRGRPGPSPLAQDAGCDGAIAAIERGCRDVRQLLTVLHETDGAF